MIQLIGRSQLEPGSIAHLNGIVNYTIITLKNGQQIVVSKTLKVMEARLSEYPNFVRVNKSVILNTDYAKLQNNLFVLPDKRVVVFSRRKWQAFQQKQKNQF
jgi:DNA-binding LytR/AlgR family response regulator